jgi:hypothetical protein
MSSQAVNLDLAEAYEVLLDSDSRQAYDVKLARLRTKAARSEEIASADPPVSRPIWTPNRPWIYTRITPPPLVRHNPYWGLTSPYHMVSEREAASTDQLQPVRPRPHLFTPLIRSPMVVPHRFRMIPRPTPHRFYPTFGAV